MLVTVGKLSAEERNVQSDGVRSGVPAALRNSPNLEKKVLRVSLSSFAAFHPQLDFVAHDMGQSTSPQLETEFEQNQGPPEQR